MDNYMPNPTIIEQTPKGEKHYDVYSRLLVDRIVFLGTQINDAVANLIIGQLLFLDQNDPKTPIQLYINSPGGSVYAGLGIYDVIQHLSAPVHTYCVGMAASMGALILLAGAQGYRHSLPHSRIMIHQPLGGARGQCSDIQIQANEIQFVKNELNTIMAHHTGLDVHNIEKITDRDNYLRPQEAKDLGIIDEIITKK